MHSLLAEIDALRSRADGTQAPPTRRARMLESGALLSIRPELLVTFYAAVALLATGVGLLVEKHWQDLGPVTLAGSLLAASLGSYALAYWLRQRGGRSTLAIEYLPLLGALLLSSALGYAEYRFRWLGEAWPRHLLILAGLHAMAAYAFGSRLVLAVALTAFAGWLGVDASVRGVLGSSDPTRALSLRALGCAAWFVVARAVHARLDGRASMTGVYETFAANLAFLGALGLLIDDTTRWLGVALLAALAWTAWRLGFARRQETFVLYAVGYSVMGACVLVGRLLDDPLLVSLLGTIIVSSGAAVLWRTRARLRERTVRE